MNLENATVILTCWSVESVKSDSVKEEANIGQKENTLIPIRLDPIGLPWGYDETHYQDLFDWDGSANHPSMRAILTAIQDKFSPPTFDEKRRRLVHASNVEAVFKEGHVVLSDKPAAMHPPRSAPDDLQKLLRAQYNLVDDIVEIFEAMPSQVPSDVLVTLRQYKKHSKPESPVWYSLQGTMRHIQSDMDTHKYEYWPDKLQAYYKDLTNHHLRLRSLLEPEQLPSDAIDEIDPPPELQHSRVKQEIEAITASAEAKVVFDESVKIGVDYFVQGVMDSLDKKNAVPPHLQKVRIRNSLVELAGVVGTIVVGLQNSIENGNSTAPEAAAALNSRLEPILELFLSLY